MANPFYIQPANPLQALMIGGEAFNSAQQRAKQAEQEQAFKEIAPLVAQGGLGDKNVLARLLALGPAGVPTMKAIADLEQSRASANSVYGTPIYGEVGGKTAIGTFDKTGRFRPIDTGGFVPTPGIKTIDTGTGTAIVSGKSGLPIAGAPAGQPIAPPGPAPAPVVPGARPGYIPKDVRGEAQQKEAGKSEAENQAAYGKARGALEANYGNLDRLITSATTLKNHAGLSGITGIQGVFPNIPGRDPANAQAILDSLKAKVGFDALQSMREASKTGGALGSVTEQEHKLLQNYIAELDRAQSKDAFQSALGKIIRFGHESKARQARAFEQDYGRIAPGGAAPPSLPGPAEAPTPQKRRTKTGIEYTIE